MLLFLWSNVCVTDIEFLECGIDFPLQKTRAYHKLKDDVPTDVKNRRHEDLHRIFRQEAEKLNTAQIRKIQLVLIEGVSIII